MYRSRNADPRKSRRRRNRISGFRLSPLLRHTGRSNTQTPEHGTNPPGCGISKASSAERETNGSLLSTFVARDGGLPQTPTAHRPALVSAFDLCLRGTLCLGSFECSAGRQFELYCFEQRLDVSAAK